jgi:hypothetical protein
MLMDKIEKKINKRFKTKYITIKKEDIETKLLWFFATLNVLFEEGERKEGGRRNTPPELNRRTSECMHHTTIMGAVRPIECYPDRQHLKSPWHRAHHLKGGGGANLFYLNYIIYIYIKRSNYLWPHMIITRNPEWNDESARACFV